MTDTRDPTDEQLAPRRRGPYRNGIKRRGEIIASASKVFGQYGYAGGSLRQIALDVGVTPAALSRHFASKEDLLVAVLEHWEYENDRVSPVDAEVRGLARFTVLPYLAYCHMQDRGLIEMFLTISAESTNADHPLHRFIAERYDHLMQKGVDDLRYARDTGEVLPMSEEDLVKEVRGVYALMDGVQLQWLLNDKVDLLRTFKETLGPIIQRWTGRPVVWLDPENTPSLVRLDAQ